MQVAKLLLDLSDSVFARTARRLDGLTDEELVWEPAPHCWSVRERADGTLRPDWAPYIGGAEVTGTGARRTTRTGGDARRPPPFTNLAWRLWHLTEVYGRRQNETALKGTTRSQEHRADPHRSAAAALASLSEAHDRWRTVLASMADEELDQRIANAKRQPALSKVGYVMAMIDEFTHHGAELAVLRDLYAHANRPDSPFGDPPNLAKVAWAGMWHLVPEFVERGADVNAESDGATALHLACAAGERDIVELLLDRGANPDARHRVAVVWGGPGRPGDRETPLDWAEHFSRSDVVELLRSRLGDARPESR